MRQPPEAEKDDEEQPIEARSVGDDRPFQVPAAPLQILKGRFDAHSAGIRAQALPSGGLIGEDDPGIVLVGLPTRTHLGRDGMVLPQLDGSVPVAPTLGRQVTAGNPAACPAPTPRQAGVLRRQPEQVVPATLLTQLDQRMPHQSAIGQQRAIGRSQMGGDPVEQQADHVPLPLFPFLVHGQHLPAHRQEPRMDQGPRTSRPR